MTSPHNNYERMIDEGDYCHIYMTFQGVSISWPMAQQMCNYHTLPKEPHPTFLIAISSKSCQTQVESIPLQQLSMPWGE